MADSQTSPAILYRISRQDIVEEIETIGKIGGDIALQCIALSVDGRRCPSAAAQNLTQFLHAFSTSIPDDVTLNQQTPVQVENILEGGLLCSHHEEQLVKSVELRSSQTIDETASAAVRAAGASGLARGSRPQPLDLAPMHAVLQPNWPLTEKTRSSNETVLTKPASMPRRHRKSNSSLTSPISLSDIKEGVRNADSSPRNPSSLKPPIPTLPKGRRRSSPTVIASGSPAGPSSLAPPITLSGRRSISESNSVARLLPRNGRSATLNQRVQDSGASEAPRTPKASGVIDLAGGDDPDITMADDATCVGTPISNTLASADSTPSKPPARRSPSTDTQRTDLPFEVDQRLKNFLRKPRPLGSSKTTGCVYIFRDTTRPELLKIGCTEAQPVARKDVIGRSCTANSTLIQLANNTIPNRHFKRVENLVHMELGHFRRRWYCDKCRRNHREWFEVTEETARQTVQKWMRFVRQEPWDFDNNLNQFWERKLKAMPNPASDETHHDHDRRHTRWQSILRPSICDCIKHVWWCLAKKEPQENRKMGPYLWRLRSDWWRLWALVLAIVQLVDYLLQRSLLSRFSISAVTLALVLATI